MERQFCHTMSHSDIEEYEAGRTNDSLSSQAEGRQSDTDIRILENLIEVTQSVWRHTDLTSTFREVGELTGLKRRQPEETGECSHVIHKCFSPYLKPR